MLSLEDSHLLVSHSKNDEIEHVVLKKILSGFDAA